MDIPSLKAFLIIAKTGSFSRAAEQLHLTQPAVSKRIQQLEEQLGNRLFDRMGRQIILTEAGACLKPDAEKILNLVTEARQKLTDLGGTVQGQLRLLTSHHIGLHRLPEVLRSYKQLFPDVKLNIGFFNSQETYQHIQQGEGDLGITTLEPNQTTITSEEVWTDSLHFVVAREHPLAKKQQLTLEDLSTYPAILPDARFFTGRIVRELFELHGVTLELDKDLSTEYLETIRALLSIGESWSVLPSTMLDQRKLVTLPVRDVLLQRKLVCIRHKDLSLNRAAQAFLALLKEHKDQRV